jgi:branched-chain amino acid transport system substrate-binding protein
VEETGDGKEMGSTNRTRVLDPCRVFPRRSALEHVFISLALFLFFISPVSAKNEEVVVGLAAPLTGDQAYIGVGVMQGAQMAVEDANIRGPVFGNTRLRFEALDDQHNPTQAVLVANKFIANPDVLGVVGHFNSSCSKAASAIYHEGRLVQISPASTNPEISRQGFDTFFRVCATDEVQAPAAAVFARNDLNVTRIAVLDDQTTYGRGLAEKFEAKFKALGGQVLRHDGITQGEKDFMPLLTKIKSVDPELVFFGGIYPEMALLLKQAKRIGLNALWMGGDGIFESSLAQLAGPDIAEGVYATMLGIDPHEVPGAKDFVTRYEARHGEIGSFSAYGYEAANVLIEAMRRAGKKDREAVLAQMHALKDFPGILGPVNFDERGDALGKSVGIFQMKNGKFKFIKEVKQEQW